MEREPLTQHELQLIRHYGPLYEAEWTRLGISARDQAWLHAGSDQRPTASAMESGLARLRALPTNMGVVAYCAWLGIDYETAKRQLGARGPGRREP